MAGLRKNPDCYFELLKFFNSVGSSSFVNYDVIFFFHSEMVTVFFFVCLFFLISFLSPVTVAATRKLT